MISSQIRAGVRAGLVAAAATAGAIIGLGIRHGDWLAPFASLGGDVIAGIGVTDPPRWLVAATGIAGHLSWMVIWGIAFATVAHRKTPPLSAVFAVVVAMAAALVARFLSPAAMGAVKFTALPAAQAALCVALMSAGLVTGRALSGTR